MGITARERFLGICRFERPGDLYIRDSFWPTALEEWVKQGAPKQIAVPTMEGQIRGIPFLYDYFHFDPRPYWLTEVISGLGGVAAHRPPELDSRIVLFWAQYTPIVPYYEPRIIAEEQVIYYKIRNAMSFKDAIFHIPATVPELSALVNYSTGAPGNISRHSNPDFDELLTKALATLDEAEREAMLEELSVMVLDDAPLVMIGHANRFVYWWPWLKNYYGEYSIRTNGAPIEYLWIDQSMKKAMGY